MAGTGRAALAAPAGAGLRYVNASMPGIARVRVPAGFRYVDAGGRAVRDAATLARIRSLVIPPAWTDVWICPREDGHIQVTGRDAKGRKQYRYHPRWRIRRDAVKYEHVIGFARKLPAIRRRVEKDLGRPGLPREKILAAVVRLLEATLMRVGNEEYVRSNGSFGLTTLRDRHVTISGSTLRFRFRGKSAKEHAIELTDRRLAAIVRRCRDLPGYELFQYTDESGEQRAIGSEDVNAYLRSIAGEDYTAKDFRTWAGTLLAALALRSFDPFRNPAEGKRNLVRAIESVASRLGNTPTICRKCYIHPAVMEAYLDGAIARALPPGCATDANDLRRAEAAVLALLQAPPQRPGRKTPAKRVRTGAVPTTRLRRSRARVPAEARSAP
jgi:DNA topoisomerase-1